MARWSPWAWTPFVIIGITAIPNAILIYGAKKVGISKVEAQPWVAAGRLDADKEQRAAFIAAGHRFFVTVEGRTAVCTLVPGPRPLPGDLRVHAYRATDANLDQVLAWPDPALPVRLDLPAPGRWLIHLDLPSSPAVASYAVTASP